MSEDESDSNEGNGLERSNGELSAAALERSRKLEGRCGSCSFYMPFREERDDKGSTRVMGECRLKCWPPPLRDSATCTHYKGRGMSFDSALHKKRAAGEPRRGGPPLTPERNSRSIETTSISIAQSLRAQLPQEIDIDMDQEEFRKVLRTVLQEELGLGDVDLAEKWRGGELVITSAKADIQEKRIPIDALFHKIVMIRDKLRVLEQKLNGSKNLEDDEKVQMQQYITACYGTLTTFNALFRDRDDWFVGNASKE